MSRNLSQLSSKHGLADGLHAAIQTLNTADAAAVDAANKRFQVGASSLMGAASFYDFLRPEHREKSVFVCNGSSCALAGTQPALRERLRKYIPDSEIGTMTCLGRCHTNHSFLFNGHTHSGATDEEVARIVSTGEAQSRAKVFARSTLAEPMLTAPFGGIDATYATLENALREAPEKLIEEMTKSGLSGRGGAHYPTGKKWAACRAANGSPKYIVCNADEGDPGAFSDRYLLEERPHVVLLGMLLAGYAVGATVGVLYIRGEYPEAIEATERALAELRGRRWLGANICGTNFSFDIHLFRGAGAYIVGEETALLAAIEGQRPEVRIRPPYPTEEGLFRRPTVVNNVMTLALAPWVAARGGAAFAQLGTPRSAGPLLVTFDGRFNRPGVCEVEMGTPLRKVVYEIAGGFSEPCKAIQTGGPLGGIVPTTLIDSLKLDDESFEAAGFSLGHGSFVGIPERVPMIEFMAHLFEFTAAESCGKCFPCRLGSQRGAEMLRSATRDEGPADRAAFDDLLDALQQTSLCGLGGGLPLPIRNVLDHFGAELAPFFSGAVRA